MSETPTDQGAVGLVVRDGEAVDHHLAVGFGIGGIFLTALLDGLRLGVHASLEVAAVGRGGVGLDVAAVVIAAHAATAFSQKLFPLFHSLSILRKIRAKNSILSLPK